jgi:hypothetical protein
MIFARSDYFSVLVFFLSFQCFFFFFSSTFSAHWNVLNRNCHNMVLCFFLPIIDICTCRVIMCVISPLQKFVDKSITKYNIIMKLNHFIIITKKPERAVKMMRVSLL